MDPAQPDPAWRAAMLAAVHGSGLAEATDALLSLTYHDPDRAWVESILLGVIADDGIEMQVRSLAITCLGHLARIHREVSRQTVLPVLHDLMQSSAFGGIARDALDDIETYALRSK
ncbi:hypothetical protein ACTWLT_19275 [Micromonospora sp. ZYX-F-536]